MEQSVLSIPRNVLADKDLLREKGRTSLAYIAFADVSGFTALTESLKQSGEGAADRIAHVIDTVVKPVCEEAVRYRGNIIAVEGDAVLASFVKKEDALTFGKRALALVNTTENKLNLSLDIGISYGLVYEAVLGNDERRVYFSAGQGIQEAYRVEKNAKANLVTNFPIHGKIQGRFYCVDLAAVEETVPKEYRIQSDAYSMSFLPLFARTKIPNEILRPGILFFDIPVPNGESERITAALHRTFDALWQSIELSRTGFIDKFKAVNTLIAVGAPYAVEECEQVSLEAMCAAEDAMRRAWKAEHLVWRSPAKGLHRGDVFAGLVCGRYTLMGDAVNTAARMKELSDGRVYFSGTMEERLRGSVAGKKITEKVRGKKEAVTVFALEESHHRTENTDYVLHRDLLQRMNAEIARNYGKKDAGGVIEMFGKIGSGKDTLVSRIKSRDGQTVTVACSPIFSHHPYHLLVELAKKKMHVETDEELYQRCQVKTFEALLPVMESVLTECPVLYTITKLEHADEQSIRHLVRLRKKFVEQGIFLVASSAHDRTGCMDGAALYEVPSLSEEDAYAYARATAGKVHGTEVFHQRSLERLVAQAEGNPLFIAEMVKAAKRDSEGHLMLEARIPVKVEDAILVNVNGLDHDEKEALKTLALLHRTEPFISAYGTFIGLEGDTEDKIRKLQTKGFLDGNKDVTNALVRSAVAHLMPETEKIERYRQIADVAEKRIDSPYLRAYYWSHGLDGIDDEARKRFVVNAWQYIIGTETVRTDKGMLEKAVEAAAQYGNNQERRMYRGLLLKQIHFLHANAINKDEYEKIYDLGCQAVALSAGEQDSYKATKAQGRALCFLERYDEGLALFRTAEQEARERGDVLEYGTAVLNHAYVLTNKLDRAQEGLDLLLEAERIIKVEEKSGREQEIGFILPGLYKSIAEGYLHMDALDAATSALDRAVKYARQFSVWHILAYSIATGGEVREKQKRYGEAVDAYTEALAVIEEKGLQLKIFENEVRELRERALGMRDT